MLDSLNCKKLKTVLEDAGCCPRCILRHFGERTYSVYAEDESVLSEITKRCGSTVQTADHCIEDELKPEQKDSGACPSPPQKRKRSSPCSCCLGVLQTGCDLNTVQMVKDAILQSSYQFQSFVLQLSTPPNIELREVLMKLYLKEEHSDLYLNCSKLDIASVRDAWKWSVGPLIARFFKADCTSKSAFSISVKMSHSELEKECKPLLTLGNFPNANGKNKTLEEIYTRSSVTRTIQKHLDSLKLLYSLPPQEASSSIQVDSVSCNHQPIYLAGRYNKFSRELSQTPWVVDGEKRLVSSVEERIVEVVLKHLTAEKIVFSSSGREDVDVRMLGSGRPFVLELLNPKTVLLTKEFMKELQIAINSSTQDVAVNDFQVVSKDDLQNLKEGEEEKRKTYCALCCISRPLTDTDAETLAGMSNLEVMQKTPIRVLHRRTQAVRKRIIFNMELKKKDKYTFLLHLETQAGTYVKEFVHGDFGRTKPSLCDILNAEMDLIELDVERVELDWPPPL